MKRSLPLSFTLCLLIIHFNLKAQNDTIAKLTGEPIDTTGWKFVNNAQLNLNDGKSSILLAQTDNGSGAVFYNQPVNFSGCKKWNIEFDFSIYGRLTEGMTFCFLKSPFQNLSDQTGLGIPADADGLRICFDILSQCNPFDGNGPKLEVRWKPKGANVECYDDEPTLFGQNILYSSSYRHARITYENGHIRIYINNKLYLQCFHELNFTGYFGFTASSIAALYAYKISNVFIYTQQAPNIERIVGQKFGLCGGGNFSFKAASIERSAYTYNWSVPSGASIISGTGTDSITLNVPSNFKEGILSVAASSQACGAGNTVKDKISVRPNHPDTILGPEHVVASQKNIKFSVNDSANVTYNWDVPDDATIVSGQGTDTIVVNWGQTAGRVHLKIYQCSDSVELKKNVHLQDCNIAINGGNCVGDTLTASYNSTSGAPVKLAWKDLNGVSILRRDAKKSIATILYNINETDHVSYVFADAQKTLYLSSSYNHNVYAIPHDSLFGYCFAGCYASNGSGANQLDSPQGIFVDADGNLFIADQNNNRVQKWAPGAKPTEGKGVTVAGGNGQGSAANQLDHPTGVFVDGSNNVYVADYNNNRIQKWAPGATAGVTVAGGNGQGSAANQLNYPISVSVDAGGNVYVLDEYNHRVQKWVQGSTEGITVAGNADGSPGSAANELYYPYDMSLDKEGNIYISDNINQRVQKWAPGATQGITFAGGNGKGKRLNQFKYPRGVFADNESSLYVADYGNDKIKKYTPSNNTIDLSFVPSKYIDQCKVVATFAEGCFAESKFIKLSYCNTIAENQFTQNSSKIKQPLISKTDLLSVYPNPAKSTIIISFIDNKPAKYYIEIRDMSGKKLKHIEGISISGKNNIHIYLNNYSSGIYLVTFLNYNGQQSSKFYKQ